MPTLAADTIQVMDESSSRRNKVTAEHAEEARRLRAIWESRREALVAAGVGTQEKFGERYGIGNQAATGFFLNGKVALSLKAALGFARGLQCAVADFSPRLAAQVAGDDSGLRVVHVNDDELALLGTFRSLDPSARDKLLAFSAGLSAAKDSKPAAPALPLLSQKQPRRVA